MPGKTRQQIVDESVQELMKPIRNGRMIAWPGMALHMVMLVVHGLFAIAEAIERKNDVPE